MQGKAHLRCRASATCAMPVRRTGPSCARTTLRCSGRAIGCVAWTSARLRHAAASSSALLLNRREGGRRLQLRSAARRWRNHEHALAAGPGGCRCWWGAPSPGADMAGLFRRWRMHEHAPGEETRPAMRWRSLERAELLPQHLRVRACVRAGVRWRAPDYCLSTCMRWTA